MIETTNRIKQGFGGSAKDYDRFSGLHREIADKFFAQVVREQAPAALLDVGCGTGYLTAKLKCHFSQSKIIGLDFSREMLEVASHKHQGVGWVLADAHDLPFSDGCFDILTSNLSYQWAGDLSRAFREARRVLSPSGILACTLFGFRTCQELFQSLGEAKTTALQFIRLPDESQVREALTISGFENPGIECELIKKEFNGMRELMAWLKSIGANNLSREGYLGPEAMSRASDIYRRKFAYSKGVAATFEVIKVYAKK